MNTLVSEGFFANVAMVVEGVGDAAAIWAMQNQLNLRWDEKGVVIVREEGKNNIQTSDYFQRIENSNFFLV